MQFKHIPNFCLLTFLKQQTCLIYKTCLYTFVLESNSQIGALVNHACIQNATMNQNADCTYYLFINFTIGFELQREG